MEPNRGRTRIGQFVLAAAAQVTAHDDEHCGDGIPGNDRPRIAALNVADDPVSGKDDPQHDQGGNYQGSLAR